ncbi:hypothetical protein Cgig2_014443 [Carnegiea gigantea]|uniref:Uncharacterized protein n=1 Tax=Carnegiea gigantea TaxID=171969 RepID=A0A9Q1GI97_9CARY|nr:hypothetical protein Cgig2_014443 [Carnegiea gigantea]
MRKSYACYQRVATLLRGGVETKTRIRTKMASSKLIFDVNDILLYGCSQMEQDGKLISNNWLEFLDCMQIVGRDPKKLALVGKRIQYVLKELKELNGGVCKSKIMLPSELILSHQNNVISKEAVKILTEGKRNQRNNNKKDKGFIKLADNKVTKLVIIVLPNYLLNLRLLSLVEEEMSNLQSVSFG